MSDSPTLLATASRTRRTVRLERTLPAGAAAVWASLTEPELLPTWFGPVLTGRPGPDEFYVLEGRGNHGDTIECKVLEWQPSRVLEHTWRYTGETESILRFELSEMDGKRTRLVVHHSNFGPEADPADYAAGWHMYTDNLHNHLAGLPPVADSDARWLELLPAYAAIAD